MDATIEVDGLRKRFGSTLALDGMSFTVTPGQVTGFVGPNGAGKSTTMRVILGLDAADEGSALIGGRSYQNLRRPLTHVGSLLDAGALQPSRSARNHLLWLAHSQGLTGRRVDEVIEQAGLQTARHPEHHEPERPTAQPVGRPRQADAPGDDGRRPNGNQDSARTRGWRPARSIHAPASPIDNRRPGRRSGAVADCRAWSRCGSWSATRWTASG
jgi:ABC transporter